MAPVGRWQKNKDLSWYAKNDKSPAATAAAEARKEEIKKIKQAESDALSKALGYEPVDRSDDNANNTPLRQREVEKAIKETAEGDEDEDTKGVGFGGFVGAGIPAEEGRDVLGGIGLEKDRHEPLSSRNKDGEHRRDRKERSRERRHRRHNDEDHRAHRRHRSRDRQRRRSRSRSRDRYHYRNERLRSYERTRDDRSHRRPRERSHSPQTLGRRDYSRDRHYGHRR